MNSPLKIHHDSDADLALLTNKSIAVIGYGSQGRAQARMMHEAGLRVIVGVRKDGKSWKTVQDDSLPFTTPSEAAKRGDIIHILLPDEQQKVVYDSEIAPHLTSQKILSFSHGFNIVFKRIVPPKNVGVVMIAPYAPGSEMYAQFQEGRGVAALLAVHQENKQRNAKNIALAMAKAMKFTQVGVFDSTFEAETHQDLFGEQVVLCGGATSLMKAALEVLVEAGYPPQLAYLECIQQLKLIVDILYKKGLNGLWNTISNTAEYGSYQTGPRLITPAVKDEMKKVLREIENGQFAAKWMNEVDEHHMKNLLAQRKKESEHLMETVGQEVRSSIIPPTTQLNDRKARSSTIKNSKKSGLPNANSVSK